MAAGESGKPGEKGKPGPSGQSALPKKERQKIKPIQVRRSLKDLLVKEDPSQLILNYSGKKIGSAFPDEDVKKQDILSEFQKEEATNGEDKRKEGGNMDRLFSTEVIDSHQRIMMEELKELLNKEDLTDEMKNNIKSLYIEVQEIYMEIKNDLKKNCPSSDDIINLYRSDDMNKKSKNAIWRKLCFYKMLGDQMSDIHICTISSYRLKYLKTIYKWYCKNKRVLFGSRFGHRSVGGEPSSRGDETTSNITTDGDTSNGDTSNGDTSNGDNSNGDATKDVIGAEGMMDGSDPVGAGVAADAVESAEGGTSQIEDSSSARREEENGVKKKKEDERENQKGDEKRGETDNYWREASDQFDNLLTRHMQEIKRPTDEGEKREVDLCHEQKDEMSNKQTDNILARYIFPNSLFEKGEEVTPEIGEDKPFSSANRGNDMELVYTADEEEEELLPTQIDTKRIMELEEEIKRQKLLIKEKEIEIINSPIGIKFKDIFGNFQDIDIND
ncbi:conserved Plasmodium protein, unknown function [Plasmodium knowlesi strain H]|uniref:Plasmodium RESA N-terminal domain-containing protein n=3 Tax=Plasmodium knowlesi TaxID=5850 RepID=A0A5K1V0L0_PLAKH|nr:conserved Plasmodium protein, unknown function [Plasmodium knowlesi strain H]OTN66834.1 Uncharacterized protein PKNOH_S08505100 [Plasmodium knowlesi]CAA9986680.1 conserved Plasmodium protein, unknown function [Plasmodium knowlesi strain H]SBO23489.1 conserved Plasmodium protein, unknown function [Plasmodium knowlesi strain H]SBO24963.1 conserved Plasmodium protein, unknown function [Plasmodium knowlesi strain H]VVS76154.1 conserved Plasmodium protein, unknown function [Plasmodium knowlesi s|eukprot:XP_002257866.1 hypothetical protein, conserved in Plasmodium species [Plasmodium knowlesi strain H]